MNEIIHDIENLERLQNLLWEKDLSKGFCRNQINTFIQTMINAKQKQVKKFEIENMSLEQYEAHLADRGFTDDI